MKLVKVAAAVLNQTPLDWEGNKQRIIEALRAARAQSVSVVCLPELVISGYGCEDAFYHPSVEYTSLAVLREVLPETKGIIASIGLPLRVQGTLFNTACLVADGKVRGFVAKQFLAGGGIYYEPRWFKAWPAEYRTTIELDGEKIPCGDIYFDCGGVRVGFEICEDAWVANRPGSSLALKGVDILLNPSASHFAFGKFETRKRFVLEGSRAFGLSYVYANHLGNESGRAIYDGGALIASSGELEAVGPRFSFRDVVLTSALIDIDASRSRRSEPASFSPQLGGPGDECVAVPFTFPKPVPKQNLLALAEWERSDEIKNEEFLRAEALALYDYLRKSRSSGFVISLSGGADSSTTAVLVATMVTLGVREIGKEAFLAKLPPTPTLSEDGTDADIVRALLMCVYQATENSSDVTRTAARELSRAIGAEFAELEIGDLVHTYISKIEHVLGRELAWNRDDLALQNIQARVRAPGVWLLANLRNALLLVTSNRSEAAVGYSTMDGDTAGSISPLGGIDKAFIRKWLVWMERHGACGLSPLPALSYVTAQQPTAELRPPGSKQTDEGDLMPYELLDEIERAALLDRLSPLEIFQRIRASEVPYSNQDLCTWITRFFTLWCRNQWKRERYAPSFHLDSESLDPKTWCRFPILSGGYRRELDELKRYVDSQADPRS
ncbi:MAG: NAD(+) synthase [Bdellovibrionota bacterium]